jgi:hypothetical protein
LDAEAIADLIDYYKIKIVIPQINAFRQTFEQKL